jgi:hypothetical protein
VSRATRRRYRARLARVRWTKRKPRRLQRRIIPAPPAEPRPSWRSTLPKGFETKVVGVTFCDGYPRNLYQLEEEVTANYLSGIDRPIMADLVRDPGNEHDPNAIRVEVRGIVRGIATLEEGVILGHIGHVGRGLAARLAPEIDRGEQWEAEVRQVLVHPDNPRNPGIVLWCHRVGEHVPAPESLAGPPTLAAR